MNLKKVIIALNLLCFSDTMVPYWQSIDYKDNIKEHKTGFCKWIKSHGLERGYERILLTMSCDDADEIPKHADAGKVFEQEAIPFQLMHNGIKVIKDGYCAPWMTDLIYALQGHHEPQEERVFYEVLKYMPPNATMVELGSYWGYYSLWFAKDIPDAQIYLVEPDPERLDLGRKNFALNGYHASYFRGYIGTCNTDAGDFHDARKIFMDDFLKENHIEHVHVLHADIQGSELDMLYSMINSIRANKVDYFFVSTHSRQLHTNCMEFLKSYNYVIIAEHSPEESFSVDGLVVARRGDLSGCKEICISKQ